ncbi:unnamed protein product [Arctogadus glacialis]
MSSQISSEPVGFRNEREQSSRTKAYRAETIERTRHYHREAQRASVSQGTPETLDPERHVDPASPRARRSTACSWLNQWLAWALHCVPSGSGVNKQQYTAAAAQETSTCSMNSTAITLCSHQEQP